MKKRNMKKGFTLVELVIVIAVIAILAGVLIPTFGGIITKAQKSAAEQAAMNEWKEFYALDLSDGVLDGKDAAVGEGPITVTGKVFKYTVNADKTYTFKFSKNNYLASFDGSEWTVTDHTTHTGSPCSDCGVTTPAQNPSEPE